MSMRLSARLRRFRAQPRAVDAVRRTAVAEPSLFLINIMSIPRSSAKHRRVSDD